MILELDLGNTRGKWRLLGAGEVVARGTLVVADIHSGHLPEQWMRLQPRRVRAANVAGREAAAGLEQALRAELGLPVEFARVEPCCAGVTCAYREIERLGVDRWLAVLAAHDRDAGPALVVDCGSAVTLDLLDTGGLHLGGYILPGLELMRRALYRDTAAVQVPPGFAAGMSLAPGDSTEQAVSRGLPLMVLGAMERALQYLRRERGATRPRLWLTGGDADLISSLCEWPHELVPELVLDGLALSNP